MTKLQPHLGLRQQRDGVSRNGDAPLGCWGKGTVTTRVGPTFQKGDGVSVEVTGLEEKQA